MRMSMKSVAVIALIVLAAPALQAQQVIVNATTIEGDGMRFPMPGREMKTGTGQIRGRVLAAETGNPIRRAQVRIMGPDIMSKTALTDAEGRFEFRDLPAGRFTLSATKSGFVSIQYGQTRPFESGRPIELVDKQVLDNADILMPRGSVIAGRIVDEFGEPVADVAVTALRQSWQNGRRRLTPAPGRIAQTNDLGQFRLYGLPPGDYYVSATLRNAGAEFMAMEMVKVAAAADSEGGPSGSTPASGYAPTYFPGTPSAADAQKITLIAGQENSSVDFALMPVRLAKITGVVLGSDGKPLSGAMISLAPQSRGDFGVSIPASARTNQEGAFTLNSVPPGDYMLQANSMQITTTTAEGGRMVMIRTFDGGGGAGANSEFGSLPLSVAGEDISNIIVVTAKGGSALGRITFEDGAKPSSITGIRVSAAPTDFDGPVGFGGGSSAVKPDGAFELKNVAGSRLIRAVNIPPGWMLKAVRLNGVDVTDTGVEFRSGEAISGLEVILTARTTTLTGTVTGRAGVPVKDYTVVVFAENSELWHLPSTRWVSGRRPDQEGRFKFESLPPGTYLAVAVDYIPSGEWNDPDVLERLKDKAHRFTLREGGNDTLELKLTSGY